MSFEKNIGSPKAIIFFEANDVILKERLMSRNNFDDTKESVDKRVANFHAKTMPVVNKYGEKVKIINVERTKEDIFNDIKSIMDAL